MNQFRNSQIVAGVPRTLSTWLVTTDDPALADRIAARLGGAPAVWSDGAEERVAVLTDADRVDAVVVGSTVEVEGGGEPVIRLAFRLDDVDAEFVFCSGSFLVAETYPRDLSAGDRVSLRLAPETYVLQRGVRAGRQVQFTFTRVDRLSDVAVGPAGAG